VFYFKFQFRYIISFELIRWKYYIVYERKSEKRHRKFKNTMTTPIYCLVGVRICLKKSIRREKEEKPRGGNAG